MKPQLAVLALALAASGTAFAQTAPQPESSLSYNVGVVSDYRYRGISQTNRRPALQAGLDYTHASGFYLGTWASTVRWIRDAGGTANVEVDLYGGYRTTFGDFGVDVGALRYLYPNSNLPVSPNTTELYVGGSWGPATLKYSHAVTNLFGFPNSENSWYLDLSATFATPWWGLSVTPHVGYQRVRNNPGFSYTDYAVTVSKEFTPGLVGSVAVVGTDNDNYRGPSGRNLGGTGVVVGVKYAF